SAATIPGRQGSPSRPNTASMSAGVRAIWNASSAVTPRCGGIAQPLGGTTREHQLPSAMVASAKITVSAQSERREGGTGLAGAYRVRTKITSRPPAGSGNQQDLPGGRPSLERAMGRGGLAEWEPRSDAHVECPRGDRRQDDAGARLELVPGRDVVREGGTG